jgi:hypothetical protein
MATTQTTRRDRSAGELAAEALWFALHTLLAVVLLGVVLAAITLAHPNPDSAPPKILATALAFLAPLIGGYLVALIWPNPSARYVWISGLLLFSAVSVWVLDLPTGNGLCEGCGATEKLWRTFFSIHHGSGLMGGDGLLAGAWTPLSMIGYALGAALGMQR